METTEKPNQFDQYIQYKALEFKFQGTSFPNSFLDDAVDRSGESAPIKNVCAKLHVSLSDKIDETVAMLNMSKRKFIELAIIEAIARSESIVDKADIYEAHYVDGGKS
jgi:hypothetical protein